MEPEDQRALVVVLVAGSLVMGIGAVVLFFIFRAFGGRKAGGSSHMGLLFGLILFVFVCCLLLFGLSYLGQ